MKKKNDDLDFAKGYYKLCNKNVYDLKFYKLVFIYKLKNKYSIIEIFLFFSLIFLFFYVMLKYVYKIYFIDFTFLNFNILFEVNIFLYICIVFFFIFFFILIGLIIELYYYRIKYLIKTKFKKK